MPILVDLDILDPVAVILALRALRVHISQVHRRQRARHTRRVQNRLALQEDLVDLLERAALGLGEEEVDRRYDRCIGTHEHNVVSVADRVEAHGRHLRKQEVEHPHCCRGYGADGSAERQRCNLRCVQICQTRVSDCEGELEDEERDTCHDCSAQRYAWRSASRQECHADAHHCCTVQHERTAAETVDGNEGESATEHLHQGHASGQDTGVGGVKVQVLLEDGRCVLSGQQTHGSDDVMCTHEGDGIDTAKLLEHLSCRGQNRPVEESLLAHLQHVRESHLSADRHGVLDVTHLIRNDFRVGLGVAQD